MTRNDMRQVVLEYINIVITIGKEEIVQLAIRAHSF